MDIDRNAVGSCESHAAEYIGFHAEGLAVYEIAPAAYGLADQQAERCEIAQREHGDLFLFADQDAGHNACDYAAVDGKPAVAHGEYLRGICDEIVELEQNVVQPCADYAGRDQPYDEVKKIVGRKAEFRRLPCAEKRSENKACGYYHAVKVYLEAEDREAVGGIDAPIPQHGEAYRRVAQHGRSQKIHRFITPLRG